MKKEAKTLKNDAIFMMVILVILGIIVIISNNVSLKYIISIAYNIIFPIIIYIGAKDQKKYAGIFGIIYSCLLILSLSVIDMLLGIFMLIHSIKYIKSCNTTIQS